VIARTGGNTRIRREYRIDVRNLLPFSAEREENNASEPNTVSVEQISAHSDGDSISAAAWLF
jgi:hypothetical protein